MVGYHRFRSVLQSGYIYWFCSVLKIERCNAKPNKTAYFSDQVPSFLSYHALSISKSCTQNYPKVFVWVFQATILPFLLSIFTIFLFVKLTWIDFTLLSLIPYNSPMINLNASTVVLVGNFMSSYHHYSYIVRKIQQ